ncbi:MAG: CRISPR-associated helicase Cas3', partial [Bacteroidetes bacterium]|nr:CRISPR-associated helicase Cas3' [Bacteroidota bacterium]
RLAGWDDLTDVHVARLCVLAALHDAGKVNHSFQDQAFPNAPRSKGHVRPMIDVLESSEWQETLLLPLHLEKTFTWFESERELTHFLMATWGHHGEPVKPKHAVPAWLWEPNDHRDPIAALDELGRSARRWFPMAFDDATPFPARRSSFQHAFNGLLTLADWIGSSFPYQDDEDVDVLHRARTLAHDRLTKQAMLAQSYQDSLKGPIGFEGILKKKTWTPHPVQDLTLNHPVYDGGSVTVLESDTGSGKTEAAIARFFRLYRAGLVDGLYFAVPTRTAAKQLFARVYRIVKTVCARFGTEPPPVVQAVPGYYNVDGVEGTPIAPFIVRWHDNLEEDEARERRWAAEGPKRYLAGAIVVGTIDQALLSALQVRHGHMRGAALLRHFLVVDEVHASDVYMTRLLDAVLEHHLAAGGHALLMSATLGTEARMQLTDQTVRTAEDVPQPADAAQRGYPLVTHVSAERKEPTAEPAAPSGYRKSVTMTTAPIAGNPAAVAERAIAAARQGARVLIIRNRVQDCRDVQAALLAALDNEARDLLLCVDGTPVPHHSRYAGEDRARLDAAIEAAFGAEDEDGNEIPIRGTIAVATQTVQMSLDISASLLMTDLCPVDVLLQRIGRLHRHGRMHPGAFGTPRCVVLTPASRDLSPAVVMKGELAGKGLNGPHGLGTVYADLRALEATWRLLEDDTPVVWTIPDDNRRLVEHGTNPHALQRIVEELAGTEPDEARGAWRRHAEWVIGERTADLLSAKHVLIERHKLFGLQEFREDLDKVQTRLGQDDVRVELPEAQPSPLVPKTGPSIRALSIPDHLIRDRGDESVSFDDLEASDMDQDEKGFSFTANGRRFRYDRMGLTRVGKA